MFRSRVAVLGIGSLVVGLLAACGGSGAGSGGEPYRVGFNSDLSGKYSLNGVGQRDGFKAYFDFVNSTGGINGHKVEVTYLDDASDVTRGTANTTQLMTARKVSVVGGYILSNVCGAAAVLAAKNRVPINCSALSDDLLDPVQPFVFTARMSQSQEAAPMMAMAKTLVGSATPRVATVIYASAASMVLEKNLQEMIRANGWNLVASQQVPLTAKDVSPQTAKIVAAKPDLIMGSLYDPLAVSFVRGLKAAGVDKPFIDYDGATYQGGLLVLKDPNFYVFSSYSLDGTGAGPGLEKYRSAVKLAGLDPGKPFVNTGYLQALSIGEGLRACGFPCDGQKLQPVFEEQKVDTGGFASGMLGYSASDHEGMHSASFYVWDPTTSRVKEALADTPAG